MLLICLYYLIQNVTINLTKCLVLSSWAELREIQLSCPHYAPSPPNFNPFHPYSVFCCSHLPPILPLSAGGRGSAEVSRKAFLVFSQSAFYGCFMTASNSRMQVLLPSPLPTYDWAVSVVSASAGPRSAGLLVSGISLPRVGVPALSLPGTTLRHIVGQRWKGGM